MNTQNRDLSLLARAIRRVVLWIYRRQGWTEVNANPDLRKCVIIAAPHTSNWDFVYFLGAATMLNVPLSFMGKKQLFRWPLGRAMRELGGIAVDRSGPQNYVQLMVDEFAKRDDFMLTIAPEGTRSKVARWKTGFYHIAVQAKVPLVLGLMDYEKKQVGLAGAIWPSGDYLKDMEKVLEFYQSTTPRHPRQGSVDFGQI
ncbi:MAG: lysophospholipid acyltransferase family protein [Chakrabartia sp.]